MLLPEIELKNPGRVIFTMTSDLCMYKIHALETVKILQVFRWKDGKKMNRFWSDITDM